MDSNLFARPAPGLHFWRAILVCPIPFDLTTFSSVNLIFGAQLHGVGSTGDSSVSIMSFEHPVEKFPIVSPAFPSREGLFSPSAL